MAQRFLILHGLTGSGEGHWQTWLAPRLRERGAWVSFPELPDSDAPDPEAWHRKLTGALAELAQDEGERLVVAHSLGSILWLRHTARIDPAHRPDRVVLVAPPSEASGVDEIAGFFPIDTDARSVGDAAGSTRIVCSDNDPYCPQGARGQYGAPLAIATEVIPGGEHLNTDAGYGPWPHLEAWCLGLRPGVAA